MKKIICLFLALMTSVTVIAANAVPSYALWYGSIESSDKDIVIKATVDGENSTHGTYDHVVNDKDNSYHVIDFTYTGKKDFLFWEIIDLKENEDYKVLKEEDKYIQIEIINPEVTDVWANAVTADSTTVHGETNSNSTTTKVKVEKPDKSLTSPKTGTELLGVSLAASGVLLFGALKKKK